MNIIALCIVISYAIMIFSLSMAIYPIVYRRELENAQRLMPYLDLVKGQARSNTDLDMVFLLIFWPAIPIYIVWPRISRIFHRLTEIES